MVLDSNLFTLSFERRTNDPTIVDLFPFPGGLPSSSSSSPPTPLYTYSRAKGAGHYSVQLVDSLTGIVLASVVCPTSNSKSKTLQLYSPDEGVVLEKKGNTFRQDWRWSWEQNEFSVRRKDGGAYVVEAVRKPDPEIDVARYSSGTKSRRPVLQMLDYNIQRLDVQDRRGLELLIVTACLNCLDQEYDEQHRDGGNIYDDGTSSVPAAASSSLPTALKSTEPNEIIIDLHTSNEVYVEHAIRLLRQDNGGEGLHVVIIRADAASTTPRAVKIAADVKARWYRLSPMSKGRTLDPMPGSTNEIAEELYQYVRDPTLDARPSDANGPRGRIKLDSPKRDRPFSVQAPPAQLAIYLSKDRIDEFERSLRAPSTATHGGASPAPKATPPNIPPKGGATADGSVNESGGGGAKKLFNRLGLRRPE